MSAKVSAGLMPKRHHMKQAEVDVYLDRQVREDAVKHKWLRPMVRGGANAQGTIYYSARDGEMVSQRIARGDYPGQGVWA